MKGSLPRLVLIPLLLAATALGEDKPKGLSTESPFAPAGGAAAPGAPVNENIEFAGITTIGKRTDLIFYDKTAKKSHWIAKGETKEGISVLNYDDRREEAVVKVNGVQKTLPLRKGAHPANPSKGLSPMPVGFNQPAPAPVAMP